MSASTFTRVGTPPQARFARFWTGPALMPAGTLIIAATTFILLRLCGWDGMDLQVYRAGGQAILRGIPLYAAEFTQTTPISLAWTYTPFAAILMVPLTVVPANAVYALWILGSVAGLVAITGIAGRGLLLAHPGRSEKGVLLLLAAAFTALTPVADGFHLGQIGVLLTFVVLWDITRGNEGRVPRGMLTGIAAAVKLTPGLFIVLLLAARRWRDAVVAMVSFAVCMSIGLIARPHDTLQFLFGGVISQPERAGAVTGATNQSLWGLFHASLPGMPVTADRLWLVGSGLAAALVVLLAGPAMRRGDSALAVTMTGLATLAISPISWLHHGVWVVPAVVILLGSASAPRRRLAIAVLLFQIVPIWWTVNLPWEVDQAQMPGWLLWYCWVHSYLWIYMCLFWALQRESATRAAADQPAHHEHALPVAVSGSAGG